MWRRQNHILGRIYIRLLSLKQEVFVGSITSTPYQSGSQMTTGMFRLTQSKSGPFPIYDLSTGLQQSKTTVSVVELELPILRST
jgi:hypothetical protein